MFTRTTPFLLQLHIRRRLQSHRTVRLNHWATDTSLRLSLKQSERKKINILSPLFLITDSWLGAHAIYKSLDSSWSEAQFLRQEPTVFPSLLAENKKPPFRFFQTLTHIIFIQLQWAREVQDFGQQQFRWTYSPYYLYSNPQGPLDSTRTLLNIL